MAQAVTKAATDTTALAALFFFNAGGQPKK